MAFSWSRRLICLKKMGVEVFAYGGGEEAIFHLGRLEIPSLLPHLFCGDSGAELSILPSLF